MTGMSEEERGFTALLENVRHEQQLIFDKILSMDQKLDQAIQITRNGDAELGRQLDLYARTLSKDIADLTVQLNQHREHGHVA